ncbi:MAG: hypothetical protein GDA67_05870 [Nitrospira sp. CR1.3]|nr:hypothetical protein [Nitrospira sp. CR1.3]
MNQRTYGMALVSLIAGAMGGFAVSFVTGTPSIAQQSDVVVRAQQFQLIDAQGRTRARLGFSADAQPYLQLSDETDTRGVWMGIARETGLAVRDEDGRTLLVLSVDDRGNPSLIISDRDRNTRAFQPER